MAIMKVATLEKLGEFLAECKSVFAAITHKHKMSDLEDYTIIDNCESTNANAPLSANQGTILNNRIEEINDALVNDVEDLQTLVGDTPVSEQIDEKIAEITPIPDSEIIALFSS